MAKDENKAIKIKAVIKKETRTDKGVEILIKDCLFIDNAQKVTTDEMIGEQTKIIVTIEREQLEMG